MRELRYADNSQSVSQQTGSSGWLRRKTGRVCRTRNFAARQSKNGDRILASLRARSARLSTNLGVARAARKGGRECTAHRTQLLKVLSRASAPNNLRPPVLHCRLALSCPPAWQASYRRQLRLGQFWINSRRAECRQLHTLSGKESQQMTPRRHVRRNWLGPQVAIA